MRQKKTNTVESRTSPMKKKAASIKMASPGLKVLPKKLPPLLSFSVKREAVNKKPTHEPEEF